jgi:hypothetical protein
MPVLVEEPLLFLASVIAMGLLIPATLGVVLESPFGAVPFFWATGILLAYPNPTRLESKSFGDEVLPTTAVAHGSR